MRSPKQIKFSSNTNNRRDHHLKKNDSLPFVAKRFSHKMGGKRNKRDAHKSFFMCSILLTYSIDFKLQLWLLFLTSLMIGLRSKNKMEKKMEKELHPKTGISSSTSLVYHPSTFRMDHDRLTLRNQLNSDHILTPTSLCCHIGQSLPCQFSLLFHISGPGFFLCMLPLTLFKQLGIHFQEHFPNVNSQPMNCLVPVTVDILFQCLKNYW